MKDEKKVKKNNTKKNTRNTRNTRNNHNNNRNYVKKNNTVKKEVKKPVVKETKIEEVKETPKVTKTNTNKFNLISYLVIILAIVLVVVCIVLSKGSKGYAYVNVDGNLQKVELKDGKLTEYPKVVEKDDYEFVEWSLDDETYSLGMKLEENDIIEAKYVRLYNVRYVFNNGLADEVVTVREGDLLDYMVPYLEGYVFVGWYANGEFYDFEQPVLNDITLEAIYAEDLDGAGEGYSD